MVGRICLPELSLHKANASDTKAQFLDLHLSNSNGFVPAKIHDILDYFDLDIVSVSF